MHKAEDISEMPGISAAKLMRNLVEAIEAFRLHEEESRGENGVFPVAIPDECLDAFRAFRDEIIAI